MDIDANPFVLVSYDDATYSYVEAHSREQERYVHASKRENKKNIHFYHTDEDRVNALFPLRYAVSLRP